MALDIPPTPTVEATSLASVLELASNPPSRPPSFQFGTAPLVLYIARVPGSRDVFLTPIKPREKVVTASDVQSSLYYIHCNYSENEESHRSSQEEPSRLSSVNTEAAYLTNVSNSKSMRRKAVPPPLPRRPAPPVSPPYPVDDGETYVPKPAVQLPYPIYEYENEGPALPPRKASLGETVERKPVLPRRSPERVPRIHLDLPMDAPLLPPRPLPPTPPQEEEQSPPSPSLHEDNIRLLRRESHTEEENNPYMRNYPPQAPTLTQQSSFSQPEPGSLTIIRRNPGSSDQWNVATIHDPPISEANTSSMLLPTAKRRTKKAGGAPIYLDITNPGYTQFVNSAYATDSSKVSFDTTSSAEKNEQPQPSEGIFSSRLYMPGSQYAEQSSDANSSLHGHRRYGSASSASGESTIPPRKPLRHSVDLTNAQQRSETRSKGYTFASPWSSLGGHCEFVTGARGTTLKCRHSYTPEGKTYPVQEEVSELRFNLPTTSSKNGASPTRSSYFSTRPHLLADVDNDGSPSVVFDASGRIDLSLGRERAGGGFGGGKAKLGKLIVYPGVGMGMLDLLVAANVGLWWRAWERV